MTDFLFEVSTDQRSTSVSVCTMGACGLGDAAFPTVTAGTLAEIVAAQPTILSDIFGADDLIIPQIWWLYKEAGGYPCTGWHRPSLG